MTKKSLAEFAAEEAKTQLSDAQLVEEAERRGFQVGKPKPLETVHEFNTRKLKGKRARLAVVSDTHFGSTYQQLSHLRAFLSYAEEAGVDGILHCGDLTDGPHQMHRDAAYNLFRHGYDAQRDYAVEAYPRPKNPKLKTHIIAGNHDYSHVNQGGGYIVRAFADLRDDVEYLGEINAYFQVGTVRILLDHPFDGIAYALSYKPQKRIEQVAPEAKPHIWLTGNYHKALHLADYRNVHGFLVPSFQAQTPWMKGKAIQSIVGGLIIEFGWDSAGIAGSMKSEFVTFKVMVEQDYPH